MLKEEIKKIIDEMPEDCSLEDIQYTLFVRSKIKKGLDDKEQGNVVPHKEVMKRLEKKLNQ